MASLNIFGVETGVATQSAIPGITSSTVVETPHRHSWKDKVYHVRIDITVPGAGIVVGCEPKENQAHGNVYVAIRDQFDGARRQLEDAARKMSGHRTQPHREKLHGSVVRLMPEEAFGFIEAPDGREYFFSREAVTTAIQWQALKEATQVRFRGQGSLYLHSHHHLRLPPGRRAGSISRMAAMSGCAVLDRPRRMPLSRRRLC